MREGKCWVNCLEMSQMEFEELEVRGEANGYPDHFVEGVEACFLRLEKISRDLSTNSTILNMKD